MIVEDNTPLGASALPEGRRDRLAVWIAGHRWAVPVIRLAGGLAVFAVMVFVLRVHLPWARVIAFAIGVALGDRAGEREKERGDSILETLLTANDFPAPPEELPSEFADYVHQRPDPRYDDRYLRPRY